MEKPHIARNDIRRYYAQMYMNTMNSANFTHIQSFLHTFMTGHCTFQIDYNSDEPLNLPPMLASSSPRMFAYYLLGGHVMFPDNVAYFRNTKLITSEAWTGTKVVIDVEVHCTKVCQLPTSAWIPAAEEGIFLATAGNSTSVVGTKRPRKRAKLTGASAGDSALISKELMEYVYKQAVPLATPLPTVSTGTVTMILDENCHIQHLGFSVHIRCTSARECT
jgi:hypothetical protein